MALYVLQICVALVFLAIRSPATLRLGAAAEKGAGEASVSFFRFAVVESLMFFAMVVAPLIVWAFGASLQQRLKAVLKTLEEAILAGASIEVDRVDVNVLTGVVNVEGFVLRNLTGYRAPYLLSVRKAYAHFNLFSFLRSCGRHVEVECLELDCVDVIYERKGDTSNLQELLKALSNASDVLVVGLKRRKDGDSPAQKRRVNVTVHRCSITDLGARVQFAAIGGLGSRASLCDLHYEDLAKQLGTRPVWEISKALLGSVVKTAITNVAGKSVGDRLM